MQYTPETQTVTPTAPNTTNTDKQKVFPLCVVFMCPLNHRLTVIFGWFAGHENDTDRG